MLGSENPASLGSYVLAILIALFERREELVSK